VVSIWVHGGHLRLAGQKIAKSTGNVVRPYELEERGLEPLAFRWLCFQTQYRSEMDFAWEAMEAADQRVRQLRRHVAEWGEPATALGEAAKGFDARVREALANDLALPQVVAIVNELDHSAEVPGPEKVALLASWDSVLGLDLLREARKAWEPSAEILDLVRARDEARSAKDFATSDRLRDQLAGLGLEVMDTAEGTKVRPRG
jgi:cysteinyl-tRNA synthetase